MNVLITGSNGFIAKNLINRLENNKKINLEKFTKKNNFKDLEKKIFKSNLIYHFAGENRSNKKISFYNNNIKLSKQISDIIIKNNLKKAIIFSSTTQIKNKNIYGNTKFLSENILKKCTKKTNSKLIIYRMPNVFGKWSRPNYNSVVATFCHAISRNKKVKLFNENKKIKFIYIDDLIDQFILELNNKSYKNHFKKIKNIISISPKVIHDTIVYMKKNRAYFSIKNLKTETLKKLYSTFLSYLPNRSFSYKIKNNIDKRGNFSEILRMGDYGQISYFTINRSQTRGNHFHHTKVEKFLILKGKVRFTFFDLNTNNTKKFVISEKDNKVVETIPGWAHNLKNIGNEKVLGIIWANEEYNNIKPDTFGYKINE